MSEHSRSRTDLQRVILEKALQGYTPVGFQMQPDSERVWLPVHWADHAGLMAVLFSDGSQYTVQQLNAFLGDEPLIDEVQNELYGYSDRMDSLSSSSPHLPSGIDVESTDIPDGMLAETPDDIPADTPVPPVEESTPAEVAAEDESLKAITAMLKRKK